MRRHQGLRFINVTDQRPDPEWPPWPEASSDAEPLPRRTFPVPGDMVPADTDNTGPLGSGPGDSSLFDRQPGRPDTAGASGTSGRGNFGLPDNSGPVPNSGLPGSAGQPG